MNRLQRLHSCLAATTLLLTGVVAGCVQPDSAQTEQDVKAQGSGSAESTNCTFTQGYWKNHASAWPVSSVQLGTVSYTESQALAVFGTPVVGNGLVALAHQLIAAKLNVAHGADAMVIAQAIDDADLMIGSLVSPSVGTGSLATSTTSSLVMQLDNYNMGVTGPGHCGDATPPPPPSPMCGNGTMESGEACDDGNVASGDGCSAACTVELPPPPPATPVCGNGLVEGDEMCDDGNLASGDGCSEACTVELPPPPPPAGPCCGNGVVESGEACDDGNLTSGDGCSEACTVELPPPPSDGPVCGNGIVEGTETCDDGNLLDGDSCSSTCTCPLTGGAGLI